MLEIRSDGSCETLMFVTKKMPNIAMTSQSTIFLIIIFFLAAAFCYILLSYILLVVSQSY